MKKALILLSGGLDSLVNLALAKAAGYQIEALTFVYGQKAQKPEIASSQKICDYYQIKHHLLDLPWFSKFDTQSALLNPNQTTDFEPNQLHDLAYTQKTAKNVWVPNRNGVFINIAAAWAEAWELQTIIVGFNQEEATTFADNSAQYLEAINNALQFSTLKTVQVISFTTNMNKVEIMQKALDLRVPLQFCWPCYLGGTNLCGQCESCVRFFKALHTLNVDEIAKHFDHKAKQYDRHAQLQKKVNKQLIAYLPEQNFEKILDLGCGSGDLCQLLAQKFRQAMITGIDFAAGMLEIAHQKVPKASFFCADAMKIEELKLTPFNLIVSSFVLQWISDLDLLFAKIKNLNLDYFVFALPVFGSCRELKISFEAAYEKIDLPLQKHVLNFPQVKLIQETLKKYFHLKLFETHTYTLEFATPRAVIRSIQDIGGNYSFYPQLSFSLRKQLFAAMFSYYEKHFKNGQGNGVKQTWEILYVQARSCGPKSIST